MLKALSVEDVAKIESETAPALPLTPGEISENPTEVPKPASPSHAAEERELRPRKRFAKTLRLTSDQLVCPIIVGYRHKLTVIS